MYGSSERDGAVVWSNPVGRHDSAYVCFATLTALLSKFCTTFFVLFEFIKYFY